MSYKLLFFLLKAGLILLYACNDNKTFNSNDNPLIGKWDIDSFSAGKDSNQLIYLMFTSMKEDYSAADFYFKNDSLFTYMDGETDTILYDFDENKKQVVINEEPGEEYDYTRLNDSMITLSMKDKTVIYLKRQ